MLARVRTAATGITDYLQKFNAVESHMCDCGQAVNRMNRLLFWCTEWDAATTDALVDATANLDSGVPQ